MSALWTSDEVCRHVGITYRQLDHWTRRGWIRPTQPAAGQGTQRRWSSADVEAVRVRAEIRRRIVELQQQ